MPAPPGSDLGPTGPGMIVQIMGHHYHNKTNQAAVGNEFVRRTLIDKLAGPELAQLGVSWPILVRPQRNETVEFMRHRPVTKAGAGEAVVRGGQPHPAAVPGEKPEDKIVLSQTNFRVQFVWKPGGPAGVPAAGGSASPPAAVSGVPAVPAGPPAGVPATGRPAGPPAPKPAPPRP